MSNSPLLFIYDYIQLRSWINLSASVKPPGTPRDLFSVSLKNLGMRSG